MFGRMRNFFMRLEKYIAVRPTPAMTEVIVQVMVEVISILGIATKEIKEWKISAPLLVNISPGIDVSRREIFEEAFWIKSSQ
jgi:hypothetical protein